MELSFALRMPDKLSKWQVLVLYDQRRLGTRPIRIPATPKPRTTWWEVLAVN